MRYDALWFIALGYVGLMALLLSGYWVSRKQATGITTELAAMMTFFLGVLILVGMPILAIALAILTLGVLFPKAAIKQYSAKVSPHELQAVLLFLVITFIVLPIVPNQSLDHFATFEAGSIEQLDPESKRVTIQPVDSPPAVGTRLEIFDPGWVYRGTITIDATTTNTASGQYEGTYFESLIVGQEVRSRLDMEVLYVVLAAINPYRVWLIVVLVSLVSFLGYVLIKAIGSRAGIGLTGLVGGLVSSTVTTLSFARRSRENQAAIPLFADRKSVV